MTAMFGCFAFAIALWTAAAIGVRRQMKSASVTPDSISPLAPVKFYMRPSGSNEPWQPVPEHPNCRATLPDLANEAAPVDQQAAPIAMPRAPFTEAEFARMWGDR